jgi:hypothetical protein
VGLLASTRVFLQTRWHLHRETCDLYAADSTGGAEMPSIFDAQPVDWGSSSGWGRKSLGSSRLQERIIAHLGTLAA